MQTGSMREPSALRPICLQHPIYKIAAYLAGGMMISLDMSKVFGSIKIGSASCHSRAASSARHNKLPIDVDAGRQICRGASAPAVSGGSTTRH